MKKGFTLIELLIVIMLLSVLVSAASWGLLIVLKTWTTQDKSAEIREDLQQGLERMVRDLRQAKDISAIDAHAIRYTARESGADNSYIFYLYHPSDTWPPDYDQSVYQLKKAVLSGGIGGSFTYGDGTIYIKQVKPPSESDLSMSGNLITINLTVAKDDETFHLLEQIIPRNFFNDEI